MDFEPLVDFYAMTVKMLPLFTSSMRIESVIAYSTGVGRIRKLPLSLPKIALFGAFH